VVFNFLQLLQLLS